jgi:hypothetical protein
VRLAILHSPASTIADLLYLRSRVVSLFSINKMMFGSKTKPTNHNVGDSNSSSRKRPNVAFDISMNTIHEVEHRNDIDEEQRSAVWLRQEEYAEIKQTFLVIVRKMMRSTEPVEETDEISCRGLGTSHAKARFCHLDYPRTLSFLSWLKKLNYLSIYIFLLYRMNRIPDKSRIKSTL